MNDAIASHTMEAAVLGNILINEEVLDNIDISRRDFESGQYAMIFDCILQLRDQKLPVDLVSVAQNLAQTGALQSIGGIMTISGLVDNATGSLESSEAYAKVLRGLSLKRELLKECRASIELITGKTKQSPIEILDTVQSSIARIGISDTCSKCCDMATLAESLEHQIEEAIKNPGEVTGVPCGIMDLDRYTGGFQPTDLIIIAGRPGMGKSTVMCNLSDGAAQLGYPVGIQSLEMSKESLGYRLISRRTGVSYQRMKNGMLDGEQVTQVVRAVAAIRKLPLFIDDTGGLTIDDIIRSARRMKREHDIQLFVVDYLQKIKGRSGEERRITVGDSAALLKDLAKELKIPVIGLAQLNRSVEYRDDKHPSLADLKESGDIEQEADIIAMLYRDEYYNPDTDQPGVLDIDFQKYRNGATKRVPLSWDGKAQYISNLSDRRIAAREKAA